MAATREVGGRGLSIAPDGNSALFVQYGKFGQDIVVVEYPGPERP